VEGRGRALRWTVAVGRESEAHPAFSLGRDVWERVIRDERDYERHVAYLQYNPVKHSHVAGVADWPY